MAEITLTREDVQDMLDLYEETNLPRLAAISRLALKSFEPNPARALIVAYNEELLSAYGDAVAKNESAEAARLHYRREAVLEIMNRLAANPFNISPVL